MTRCLGYDEDGKGFPCPQVPGTPWTRLWCDECDKRRRDRLTLQFETLGERTTRMKESD